ncbi:hypothetical protein b23_0223 [Synechococcus phage B23]|nr:hypothetical protein b23_0223 [Synechococcus phage B23]
MITKERLLDLYTNCYDKIYHDDITDAVEYYLAELLGCAIIQSDHDLEMSEAQWNNLVKVCQTIVTHEQQFNMSAYHKPNMCGTSHCIAGWAVCVELNNFNITNYMLVSGIEAKYGYKFDDMFTTNCTIASAVLSPLVYPFFFLLGGDIKVTNQIMMNEFIKPVLQIAKEQNVVTVE